MSNVDTALEGFLADPAAFFGMSYTAMHSVPRPELNELQRAGLVHRFEQQRGRVAMLERLADRQGIDSISDFADVVPLLFEHTMYKSYPVALLERQQFDKLTTWFAKLTSADLSSVDPSQCDSIDSWRRVLFEQTDLVLSVSGGTSGTMSFFPWNRYEKELRSKARRVSEVQTFGDEPSRVALEEPYHYVSAANRNNCQTLGRDDMIRLMTLGVEGYGHLLKPEGESDDLLWLASRMRLAAARGDATRIDVPESLLARRAELQAAEAQAREREVAFYDEVAGLRGQRIFWSDPPFRLYSLAASRLERGETWTFDPESALVIAGGSKGNALPEDWPETVRRFLDMPIKWAYGMSEICNHMLCAQRRYHIQPWVIPFILNPETSELLPRSGVQRGRAAFFDLLAESHWGGLITGDEIEIDFDQQCACGATTVHVSSHIERLSEKRGGDDKIICAASPQAHADAMTYLVGY